MVSTRVKAEQDIHQKLLSAGTAADRAAVWEAIALAAQRRRVYDGKVDPRYARMQAASAEELLRVRDGIGGEAAAIELAKTSAKYPNIWRRQ
jgi:hypothetical protein